MRILFVAPYLPSPPRFGGQRRLDGLMRGLARRHEVSVLAFNKIDPYASSSLTATREYCEHVAAVREVDLESNGKRKRWLQARSLVSRSSFEGLLARGRIEFQSKLRTLMASRSFDVIQVEFAQMGAYDFGAGRQVSSPLLVLDEHNIEFDLARRSADSSESLPRRAYQEINWRKLRVEEERFWSQCHGVVVTSPRDHDLLTSIDASVRAAVVPNGVDVQAFQPTRATPEPNRILFFGAINYFPNQDGLIHFLDHTFPLVLQERPEASLRIVGPGARKPIVSRQNKNIVIAGFVDDLNEEIDKASVVIVPLRVGGGTRLKIVEAMAKGKAIVSTRLGAEGIDLVHEKHVLFADEPADFARQIERVLSDPALARSLGEAARELAVTRYSWEAIVAQLEGFYERLRDTGAPSHVKRSA